MLRRQSMRRGVDYDLVAVPAEYFALGRRRTEHMLTYQRDRLCLADLLANAYLQGVEDGWTSALASPDPTP